MEPKAMENLCRMFGDQNIWEPPAPPEPPPEEPEPQLAPQRSRSRVRQDTRKPKAMDYSYSSSDDEDSELKTRNCTNKVLPRGKRVGRDGKSVHVDSSSGTATFSEAEQDEIALQDLGLNERDKSPPGEAFIAWNFLIRYPEMYVGKGNGPKVTAYFEEKALFENQQWDIFYLYEPDEKKEDPILLVPTRQLCALLRRINRQLMINLTIPGGGNEKKFYTRFGTLNTPVPRYLCRTDDSASYKKLLYSTPQPEAEDDLTDLTQIQRDEFAEIVKKIIDSCQRSGNGKGKRKKAEKRFDDRKEWGRTTKRVQRYLGLREKANPIASYRVITGQEPAPHKELKLEIDAPAPFEQDGHVVFVCFDIETYEKNPGLVTELGFALLDTEKLVDVAPGTGAQNWFDLIQSHHIRIKEYSYMKNTEYVQGCPDSFMFGESEFVPLTEVLGVVEEIMSPKSESGHLRKVVIVGHDVKQDIQYLSTLDFDIYEMANLLEVVDNQKLHQHRSKFYNGQSLCAVLAGLDIPYRFLHNAGNDAVYTLQSLLGLAVLKRQESLERARKRQASHGTTDQRIEPDAEAGWSTGGEDTDGGHPTITYLGAPKRHIDHVQFEDQDSADAAG